MTLIYIYVFKKDVGKVSSHGNGYIFVFMNTKLILAQTLCFTVCRADPYKTDCISIPSS